MRTSAWPDVVEGLPPRGSHPLAVCWMPTFVFLYVSGSPMGQLEILLKRFWLLLASTHFQGSHS